MTRGQAQNTCSCVPAHLVSGNVGADKDSDKRQRATIQAFARRGGYELVAEHYDAAVSGADPIEGREALLRYSTGLRTMAPISPCWPRAVFNYSRRPAMT